MPKVYYTAWARSDALRALKMMHLLGQKTGFRDPDFDPHSIGCPDELITTRVNIRPVLREEMAGPVRAPESDALVGFLLVVFTATGPWLYQYESFRCVHSPLPLQGPESDVFAGL